LGGDRGAGGRQHDRQLRPVGPQVAAKPPQGSQRRVLGMRARANTGTLGGHPTDAKGGPPGGHLVFAQPAAPVPGSWQIMSLLGYSGQNRPSRLGGGATATLARWLARPLEERRAGPERTDSGGSA